MKSSMTYVEELMTLTPATLLKKKKRVDLDIKQTPEVYIDQRSNPKDVQKWLKLKGFNDEVCKTLVEFTGALILDLSKARCNLLCGEDEGKRLYSQLQLQKNICKV